MPGGRSFEEVVGWERDRLDRSVQEAESVLANAERDAATTVIAVQGTKGYPHLDAKRRADERSISGARSALLAAEQARQEFLMRPEVRAVIPLLNQQARDQGPLQELERLRGEQGARLEQLEVQASAERDRARAAGEDAALQSSRAEQLDRQLQEARASIAQISAAEASLRDTESRERARAAEEAARDDSVFWFRRWMTSLVVGNGAAFFVICTGLLQSNRLELALALALEPLRYFGLGLVFAGGLPFLMWAVRALAEAGRRGQVFTAAAMPAARIAILCASSVSPVCFVLGGWSAFDGVARAQTMVAPVAAEQLRRAADDAELSRLARERALAGKEGAAHTPAPASRHDEVPPPAIPHEQGL